MRASSSPSCGFTLIEALAAIVIISFLGFALWGMLGPFPARAPGRRFAEAGLHNLTHALEVYKSDFGSYPPDNFPSDNGSEMIWYYLCRAHSCGDSKYGPYLKVKPGNLAASDRLAAWKYRTPYGGDYHYIRKVDSDGECRKFLLVDPGRDKQLGGQLDREKGFIVNDRKKAADNLDNFMPAPARKK